MMWCVVGVRGRRSDERTVWSRVAGSLSQEEVAVTKLRHMFQTVCECSNKSSNAEDICFFVRSLTI